MNRLPGCDRTTRRSELAVFASLGFAGVLMVALAAAQVTRFGDRGDRITDPLAAASPADDSRAVATKVSGPAESPAAPSDLAADKIRSAVGSGLSLVRR